MSPTPEDVQHLIDLAEGEFKQTTKGYLQGTPGKHWTAGLGYLSNAREEAGLLVAPTPTPPPPPPPPPPTNVGTGLALIAYGGTLKDHQHVNDGSKIYDVVVGGWSEAAFLSTCDGKSYAYTVTTTGVASPTQYVILDPLGNSGLTGALKPDDYIAKCAALKAAHPGLDGIFLDNNVAFGKTYKPSVPESQLLTILEHVSAGLKSHGLGWLGNTGGYISGDLGSNDGSIWRSWAQSCEPYFDYLLCENWQQTPPGTPVGYLRRLRGVDAWYKYWDDWQKCPAAVPGKFMAATYEHGDKMYSLYGRASMLLAPGADPRNIFYAANDNLSDPYGETWQKRNPTPHVDPVAGTATL